MLSYSFYTEFVNSTADAVDKAPITQVATPGPGSISCLICGQFLA